MTIAIVGEKDDGKLEVAAYPDDICWGMTELNQKFSSTAMRTDRIYPNGVLHVWGRVRFIVGMAASSTDIEVIETTSSACIDYLAFI